MKLTTDVFTYRLEWHTIDGKQINTHHSGCLIHTAILNT